MKNSPLQRETCRKLLTKHGQYYTKMYRTWASVIQRCTDKNSTSYKDYGSKGIIVCQEWKDNFVNFYNWAIDNGYSEDLTIDRINSNLGYMPSNCRWVDTFVQAQNRRTPKNNTSGYTGIWLDKNKWRSVIRFNKKSKSLGYYDNIIDAVIVRNRFIIHNNLNHPLQEVK